MKYYRVYKHNVCLVFVLRYTQTHKYHTEKSYAILKLFFLFYYPPKREKFGLHLLSLLPSLHLAVFRLLVACDQQTLLHQ